MVNGLIPDIDVVFNHGPSMRSNNALFPKPIKAQSEGIKSKQRDSILYNGVHIYNCLPPYVRNINDDICEFKQKLDNFLSMIPDQPAIPGFIPEAKDLFGNSSNSILDWTRFLGLSDDDPLDV